MKTVTLKYVSCKMNGQHFLCEKKKYIYIFYNLLNVTHLWVATQQLKNTALMESAPSRSSNKIHTYQVSVFFSCFVFFSVYSLCATREEEGASVAA